MGVPKFYRWISERYPCLSEVVKEHQIPEFDNLYLDMNGIIHQCSHPNDEDVHFRISEEKIFADIFHYLEVLFRIIKPRKVFFMAVDGVAPRAKMNQQRGRRFRSAKEAEEKIKKALEKGEVLPTEARFDSNCITPGTDFMARLQEQLKYFVHYKLSTDKTWQGVNVYLSGHETPGEGEHKIMEFIRSESAKPGHNPNTRHCLYGLDADLIMLGLTSHEPNFSLLREEVRFGGKKSQKRISAPEETTFHLLHLSLMREYIDYEFSELRKKISFEYDLERIIDDWVLMGFLVGNDFIPHLPHLHINHDALPLLYRTYISVLPTIGGYLNENGHLNLAHFEKYLEKLSDFDRDHFNEVFVDLKWFESKVGNKYLNEAAGLAAEEADIKDMKKSKASDGSLCLAALDGVKDSNSTPGRAPEGTDEDGEDDDMFETEFRQYKRTYYMTKMGVEVVSDEFLANQAKCYVEGIQWILHYYYHGVQSWSWYYPYHYAPFLSDVRNISSLTLTFELAKPFLPFEQLLGVLPAASKDLLPQCYQHLMTSPSSPIVEYYPQDFRTDLNGKQQEWEAVVLIPFIDEKCLLAAMEPYAHQMTPSEKARNRHTECAVYCFDKELDYAYNSPLPQILSDIIHCHVRQTPIPMDAWRVSLDHVGRRVDRGALYFSGFPTLQHIQHKFYKKKSGVMVFQQSSRGESMILEILDSQEMEQVDNVAALVLGKPVFVNWPHLMEARVVAVSDGEIKYSLEEPSGSQMLYLGNTSPPAKVTNLTDKEQKEWVKEVQGLTEHFGKRKGIVISETDVVVYAQLLTGRKYVIGQNGKVLLEKQFAKQVLPYPYQTIVKDIKAFDSSMAHFKTLEELFPPGISVFMVGNPYYGAIGDVQDSSDVISEGRVRVVFSIPCDPQLDALIQNQHKYSVKYSPGYVLASRLGITSYLVSRFSGSIFIGRGSKKNPHGEQKVNVGLNLKFNKKNEEVPGYTKRTEKEWLYSAAVEELLSEYLERFSEVFDFVARNSHDDFLYEDDIWPGEDENGAEKIQEIQTWLKTNPVSSSSRSSCDLQILDTGIVEKIEEELEKTKAKKMNKKVRVTVKPYLLFRPLEQQHGVVPDPEAEYNLFDRVVNVRESFSVPLGLRGTVIGIKGAEREAEVLYEVLFDEEFAGGLTIRCSPGRGYRLPPSALINLSHGSRKEKGSHKLTAVVKPQPSSSHPAHKSQLGGLNHSPRSPFIPTQQNGQQSFNLRADTQGNRHSPHKALNQKNQHKDSSTEMEFSNVWQSLQSSGIPQKPPAHWQNNAWKSSGSEPQQRQLEVQNKQSQGNDSSNKPAAGGNIRLLKRNDNLNAALLQGPSDKVSTEFEELIANLMISKEPEPTQYHPPKDPKSQSGEPLSPHSFAMKGTLVLKEMLKIDNSATSSSAPDSTSFSGGQNSETPTTQQQQQSKRRSSKKLAARINTPQNEAPALPLSGQPPILPSIAAELGRVCMNLGMGPPEFAFLHNRQSLTVCQVKLSNGLLVHGPQCHSETEAKEKAVLFALQRLNSLGSFPLPPSIFPAVQQMRPLAPHPTMFSQPPGGLLMPPQGFGPLHWGMQLPHQGQPFYGGTFPGAWPPASTSAGGSHNQFVPLQVTKKRVSGQSRNQEAKQLSTSTANAGQIEGSGPSQPASVPPSDHKTHTHTHEPAEKPTPTTPKTPRQKTNTHTPGSASKRKHRKLAVNFEAAKVTD
ncbi:5'-3' exoribonuclease 1-like isoform X2 [Myxocyprinus asiaticus]|uniref:5'-3' exoribonuclease 1-like isoform X2 n=1 Tax=Myxocyprinus asiaticus TaxID=70543 RepID=UPI0022224CA7|nr:5'-3' exoribonuclease 1-like isoform X2 [Myxocyprinus asiaticus]